MNAIFELIMKLLSLWEQYKTKQKKAKRDKEVKAVKENPAKWFNNHFGGVRDDLSDKADKADDADQAGTKPD